MSTTKSSPLLVGCDPEFFVRDSTNTIISAYGMIPGTKQEPRSIGNGAVQVDGVALEFNTKPAATPEEFNANIIDIRIFTAEIHEAAKTQA